MEGWDEVLQPGTPKDVVIQSWRGPEFVGQAVLLSLVVMGIFYVFTSYASAIGWGTGDMAAFAACKKGKPCGST